jgi:hypothetical protein
LIKIIISFSIKMNANLLSQPAQPYSFEWAVKDVASYNDYSHSESSDGKVTSGSYRVLLPDGRIQIVTYKDDGYGYVADVSYQGEAKYPEYKPAPAYKAPAANVYKTPEAPVYQAPAPVYKVPEAPIYRAPAPSPSYTVPKPSYESPAYEAPVVQTTEAPVVVYSTPASPSYSAPVYKVPAAAPTYKAPESPVYKAPEYIVPSYKPPTKVASVYEAPVTPVPVYRAPSASVPVPLMYRATAKQATYRN